MVDLEKETRRCWLWSSWWSCRAIRASMASSTDASCIKAIFLSFWKNLKALTENPLEENKSFNSSSLTEEGMLERCSVADGGKMLLKFLDPGFLKRCRAEPEKSRVSTCSSCPASSRGSCTTGCLDSITLITLPWRR